MPLDPRTVNGWLPCGCSDLSRPPAAPCAARLSDSIARPTHTQSRRWVLAVVLYSLAVSVKMNVLLMAPGVLAVLLKASAALRCAALC